jgi:hypothetical protein
MRMLFMASGMINPDGQVSTDQHGRGRFQVVIRYLARPRPESQFEAVGQEPLDAR